MSNMDSTVKGGWSTVDLTKRPMASHEAIAGRTASRGKDGQEHGWPWQDSKQ